MERYVNGSETFILSVKQKKSSDLSINFHNDVSMESY